MTWVVLSSALGGALIGALYFRSAVVIMSSAQVAIFLFGLYFAGEIGGLQLLGFLVAALSSHQTAYFFAFVIRLYMSGDISSKSPTDTRTARLRGGGLAPGVGERLDKVVVLASEIERRAPQVRNEAAQMSHLVREIRASIEDRHVNLFR